MIVNSPSQIQNLPDIWGEGAIFAFSGLDGETCSSTGFTATFGAHPFDLLIHMPTRRSLKIRLEDPGQVEIAVNDLLLVKNGQADLLVTFSAWHTLMGSAPPGAQVTLAEEGGTPCEGLSQISADREVGDVLVLLRSGDRFALSYGWSEEEARERAEAALKLDLRAVSGERLRIYEKLPPLPDPGLDRLFKKCLSVMKVNTLGPEVTIEQRWSTPDRVPHQHLWLWDSVFHSLAMNFIDPDSSWSFLKSVLDFQRPDGMIPHMMLPVGLTSSITQPPVLAWGVWENYGSLKRKDRLAYALPRLEKYLNWDLVNRDQNGNSLLEWFIEGDVRCRSGESGLDNSPRFDEALVLDAVDFSTFAALDCFALSRIASEVGDSEKARRWQKQGQVITAQIHDLLWDEQKGFYFDRRMDGSLSDVRAASGFLPLLLPGISTGRAARLVAALQDPAHFGTIFPVPTVSASHPEWSTDLWRGATWINLNFLIVRGLKQQGFSVEARALAEKTVFFVEKYYQRYGVIFEFFDSKDERPPVACDRKGPRVEPYDIRRKYDSIRDYHWSAALIFCILRELSK